MTEKELRAWYAEASQRWMKYADLIQAKDVENRKRHFNIASWMKLKSVNLKVKLVEKEK